MFFWDISLVSLVMSLIIMVTGFWVYKKNGSIAALLIGIAYIFFITPRIAYLMHVSGMVYTFIFLRVIGYILELIAVIRLGYKKN
ncbi:TPA: hypothetical protein DIC20_04940 [Candidatus Dependentiae bacterium]|nr:MAG: hypothetical protein US03_C0007G0046 [candidate division TM6 bacterium GW2011_GWF2_36_131]KKQ03012.1 MAG: hypothetical protein US13_C0007G0022 [candidate division TM6 bacterium GW2011_GWE2_36_25]KKQ19569.1 MAG: hypothetical protein US32_C0007G0022 [candidate division TM6 bacterium GW2011_GWA2_36_9]HBR71084.1 hypothetical protein [Candidatus Dependentiae bacterium]HCU01020.1 hypothetical protein [Candidatus Dependentiae bacterium]